MNSNTDTTKNLIAGGFLSGFVEVNVEKPADGLNGECIVHYGGKYSQYRMKVPIVNGIRNGMALIDNNGTPYIKLEYRNEEVTGNVERMDINGHVVLRGSLVSGMEKGLFEEYDGNMDVKWKGYYRNGERFSVVMKSQRMKGYYEEILEADGSLLSIAQYDDGLNDKKGRCMEYENGKWIGEWVYENGVKVKSICEDRNEILIRYDENGRGRNVEEWERVLVLLSNRINPNIHFHPDSMMVYDIGSEQSYGMMEWNEKCFVIDWLNNVNRVTMIDLIKNEMIVYENGEEVKMNCVDDVIDLNVNGKRWEGYVKNGKPFGYGVMYDEEGRKEYEGFIMDGMKNGRGIEFYSDIGRVKYDGCLCKDNHNGRGILYNRNGLVEHDGLWKNGKPYCNQFDGLTIDNHTESIEIVNNSFNEVKSFVPPFFLHSLKRMVIGDDCFERVRLFELNGLIELKSVVIGEESNTILKDLCGYSCFKEVDGCFRIVNCPILKSLQIGDYSFGDYRLFELNNLPSLQSIDIGYCCFYWIPSLSLTDYPQLQSIRLADESFDSVRSVVFENLPLLQSIEIGQEALAGDWCDDRKMIRDEPFNYKNTLTMRNLPSLTSIRGDKDNFETIGSMILENIPQLSCDGIQFGDGCFSYTYSLQSSSMYDVISSLFDSPALESVIRSKSNYVNSSQL